jgi:hypothetical protein
MKQGNASFEEFLSVFHEDSQIILAAYESTRYPGYISFDSIARAVFLNGVDKTFFARQIDRAHEEYDKRTLSDLEIMFQAHNLEKGHLRAQPSSKTVGFALSADVEDTEDNLALAVTPGNSRPKLSGPCPSECCSFCWSKNFRRTDHKLSQCDYAKRAETKVASSTSVSVSTSKASSENPKALLAGKSTEEVISFYDSFVDENYDTYIAAVKTSKKSGQSGGSALVAIATADPMSEFQDQLSALSAKYEAVGATLPWYWDNAASYSISNNFDNLIEVIPLSVPNWIGGVGTGVQLTHRGYLNFLPRKLGLCWYSKDSAVNLISLGFWQRNGGSYSSSGTDYLTVMDSEGLLFDKVHLQKNNLSPVSAHILRKDV